MHGGKQRARSNLGKVSCSRMANRFISSALIPFLWGCAMNVHAQRTTLV